MLDSGSGLLSPWVLIRVMGSYKTRSFKTKLVTYTKQVQSGQELVEKEQEDAVKKLEYVENNLELAKEFQGIFKSMEQEAEEEFAKAQKPWAEAYGKVQRAKRNYHSACKSYNNATQAVSAATKDDNIPAEKIRKLEDTANKSENSMAKMRKKYEEKLARIEPLNTAYEHEMIKIFDKCQRMEERKLHFLQEMLVEYHKSLNVTDDSRLSDILKDQLQSAYNANVKHDLGWWSENHGADMPKNWPRFEFYALDYNENFFNNACQAYHFGGHDKLPCRKTWKKWNNLLDQGRSLSQDCFSVATVHMDILDDELRKISQEDMQAVRDNLARPLGVSNRNELPCQTTLGQGDSGLIRNEGQSSLRKYHMFYCERHSSCNSRANCSGNSKVSGSRNSLLFFEDDIPGDMGEESIAVLSPRAREMKSNLDASSTSRSKEIFQSVGREDASFELGQSVASCNAADTCSQMLGDISIPIGELSGVDLLMCGQASMREISLLPVANNVPKIERTETRVSDGGRDTTFDTLIGETEPGESSTSGYNDIDVNESDPYNTYQVPPKRSSVSPVTSSPTNGVDNPFVTDPGGNRSDDEWDDPPPSEDIIGVPVRALYVYNAVEDDELSFKAGDVFTKLSEEDAQGWCRGRFNGKEGLYPANYVQLV
eukprot:gene11322-21513_t